MFAVIESGGKQHTVSEGESLKVELLSEEEGSTIEFNKVWWYQMARTLKLLSLRGKCQSHSEVNSHGKHDKIKFSKWKEGLSKPMVTDKNIVKLQ